MELPNKNSAFVPSEKITEYLLSESHAVGKSKAKFFRSLGFIESNIKYLEQGLLHIASMGRVAETQKTSFGTKYVVDGMLETPKGATIQLRTVWIIETEQNSPRFITAYPLD